MKTTLFLRLAVLPTIAIALAVSPAMRAAEAPVAPSTAAKAPADPARWEKDIAAFEKADAANPPPKGAILFLGSSSIRMWKTLAADFPEHRVINRGFGGSQICDSVAFGERIVFPYEPRLIVFYAGGNDLNARKSPEQVFGDFKAFVEKVQAKLPATEIAFISSAGNPARWSQIANVRALNRMVEAYTRERPRLKDIDTHSKMLGPDGLPRPEIFVADRLHMNAEGYKLWREIVLPFLGSPEKK